MIEGLINQLEDAGVTISGNGDSLVCSGAKEAIDHLASAIREHKPDLMQLAKTRAFEADYTLWMRTEDLAAMPLPSHLMVRKDGKLMTLAAKDLAKQFPGVLVKGALHSLGVELVRVKVQESNGKR